jgi:hypothetical protein
LGLFEREALPTLRWNMPSRTHFSMDNSRAMARPLLWLWVTYCAPTIIDGLNTTQFQSQAIRVIALRSMQAEIRFLTQSENAF